MLISVIKMTYQCSRLHALLICTTYICVYYKQRSACACPCMRHPVAPAHSLCCCQASTYTQDRETPTTTFYLQHNNTYAGVHAPQVVHCNPAEWSHKRSTVSQYTGAAITSRIPPVPNCLASTCVCLHTCMSRRCHPVSVTAGWAALSWCWLPCRQLAPTHNSLHSRHTVGSGKNITIHNLLLHLWAAIANCKATPAYGPSRLGAARLIIFLLDSSKRRTRL
jgi:hypothetical protein